VEAADADQLLADRRRQRVRAERRDAEDAERLRAAVDRRGLGRERRGRR
jgi:hypothetical protein